MISVDLHLRDCTATVEAYPADAISGGFITIKVEGPGQYVSIFGKPADAERFEQIAALLNETFEARKPQPLKPQPQPDRAAEAGDYMSPL